MSIQESPAAFRHEHVSTNGITLHTVQAGDAGGPLVILLHGFPEFWYGWRHQIAPLATAGYRVWAPDQRGYGESSKPRRISAYRIDRLAEDVLGLMDAAGRERAHLVGHDWGGAVAWRVAALHPQRVERLAILNCPHPRVMTQNLTRNAGQAARSSYVFFFQLPRLPELLLGAHEHALLARSLRRSSRPGTFSDEELARYREAWSQPGALRAMVNWYRALRFGAGGRGGGGRITVPTLILWGERDRFLAPELAEQSLAMCDSGRLVRLQSATHWLQHEEPERITQALLGFLSGAGQTPHSEPRLRG
jgi:epoxide hydrolase 4